MPFGLPPRSDFTSEKLRASVRVAFSPSTTSAWRRFSLLRRCAYSGELAMRRILARQRRVHAQRLGDLAHLDVRVLRQLDDVRRHARRRRKIHRRRR